MATEGHFKVKFIRILAIPKSRKKDVFILESMGQEDVPDGRYNITNGIPKELQDCLKIVETPYGFGWGVQRLRNQNE